MPNARAAVLRQTGTPLIIETVEVGPVAPGDVLVRIRAASLCHTDLEAIEGALAVKLPAVLGHEAAGEIAELGAGVTDHAIGDRVVLSWNPHCGRCFYCERAQPILCRAFLANGPKAFHFDGKPRLTCDGTPMHQLMYLGGFSEYCVVPAQSAIRVPDAMPFDRAALLGCGVMTGIGAATRIADLRWGAVAMVIGCGAVGLSAIQGCRLAGAAMIIAVDPNPARRQLAQAIGATHACEPSDAPALARSLTETRGADVVIEAAGRPETFRLSMEAARPGGHVVWLGKTGVNEDVAFRWGSLMQEKHITRSSYGGAKPAQDFPLLARAYLDGTLEARRDDLRPHPARGHQRRLRGPEARRDRPQRDHLLMKVYEGGRSLDGAVVTVDGAPLNPRFDLRQFSKMGFEWTYEGDGPRQLALALLADHLGDPQRALALTEDFMRTVVAVLDNAWQLTSDDIDAAL
jgi:S-(hydroxymethyl)glutathione dehydrogenase/alcohol dehydrogenase